MRAEPLAAVLVLLALSSCGAPVETPATVRPGEESGREAGIDHPFFPLHPGTVWLYAGEEDGQPLTEEIAALEPAVWPGAPPCIPLQQRRFLADALVELTTEWFAQDRDGNVWLWGEESFALEGGRFVRTRDSWRAGPDARPALLFPAFAEVGDETVLHLPHASETYMVADVEAVVSTPAATFSGCLEVHENPGDPDQDILLYAPGTGLAALRAANGYKLLVAMQRPR